MSEPKASSAAPCPFRKSPRTQHLVSTNSERRPNIRHKKTSATILSPQIRKNTGLTNLPLQISKKLIYCTRCTIIKQHLVHQNTLYAQFVRQVFLMKVISNKKIPQPQKDYGTRYNSLQSLQRHQCLNRSLNLQRITLSQSFLFGNSTENLHSRRID